MVPRPRGRLGALSVRGTLIPRGTTLLINTAPTPMVEAVTTAVDGRHTVDVSSQGLAEMAELLHAEVAGFVTEVRAH